MKERVTQTVRSYEAKNPIRVFDDVQEQAAKEQAASMRGSDQPMQECIEFGRTWAKIGLSFAVQDYYTAYISREIKRELEESA